VKRELWPWLLVAALLVFVGDVAARRWPEKQMVSLAPAKPHRTIKAASGLIA